MAQQKLNDIIAEKKEWKKEQYDLVHPSFAQQIQNQLEQHREAVHVLKDECIEQHELVKAKETEKNVIKKN